jgi:hypothetical protein
MIKEGNMIDINKVIAVVPNQSVGWLETKLPKTVMMRLQSYIEAAKKNPINFNNQLAGNISKSLLIEDKDNWFFKTILIPLIGKFMEDYPQYRYNITFLSENAPHYLNTFWVNFQKENEFNPLHDHGGIFSFVVWVKIPTHWKEQHALPIAANSNLAKTSNFEFNYTNILGQISYYEYKLDKKSEGGMLFFPAKLMHTVYPFYNCDKERVSISGNIFFDVSEKSMRQLRDT